MTNLPTAEAQAEHSPEEPVCFRLLESPYTHHPHTDLLFVPEMVRSMSCLLFLKGPVLHGSTLAAHGPYKRIVQEAGETAHGLKALTDLSEDPGSIYST